MEQVVGQALTDATAATAPPAAATEAGAAAAAAAADDDDGMARPPPPTTSSFGYLGGKWCWEWRVVSNASGNVGLGVCTSRASLRAAPGKEDGEGWAFYSTSELLHAGGGGPQGKGSSAPYGTGDVIGVELDLHEGTLRFLKNDRDIGLSFSGLRKHPARVGGAGTGFEVRTCTCMGQTMDVFLWVFPVSSSPHSPIPHTPYHSKHSFALSPPPSLTNPTYINTPQNKGPRRARLPPVRLPRGARRPPAAAGAQKRRGPAGV